MDWDPLGIGQCGNSISARSIDMINKTTQLSVCENEERNSSEGCETKKSRTDKFSGRETWTDDIEFDLNAELSTSSYLSSESFLTFSTALTVLKQEPQTEHFKENITLLASGTIVDKTLMNEVCRSSCQKSRDVLIEAVRGACCTLHSTQPGSEIRNCQNDKSESSKACPARIDSAISQIVCENVVSPHPDDHKFQYILAASTSIATKNNEETLTYLNQSQSYEIKLMKSGDLSFYRDKILKSVIKIRFYERRLQYMEHEQMHQWQALHPGERIIEVDVPLSYGLCRVLQPFNTNLLNAVEVFWDPLKEVGVYIKVNCISTEFTPKKHGGEKGVPFKLQIETYIESYNSASLETTVAGGSSLSHSSLPPLGSAEAVRETGKFIPINNNASNHLASGMQAVHAAACQIKVFKLKGADRKHKQDRERIQKRSPSEQGVYQPSYECTIMNDIRLDLITPSPCFSHENMKIRSPKQDDPLSYTCTPPASNPNSETINNSASKGSPTLGPMNVTIFQSPQQTGGADVDNVVDIMPKATPVQVAQWLTYHRLTTYLPTFAHFSGSDILRMSKEDLTQICGLADGIRMFNILRAKTLVPRLTIYVSIDNRSYNAIYLLSNTVNEFVKKLHHLPGLDKLLSNEVHFNGAWGGVPTNHSGHSSNKFSEVTESSIYLCGPSGVYINITDEVLNNEIKDGGLYALNVKNGNVILKSINKR